METKIELKMNDAEIVNPDFNDYYTKEEADNTFQPIGDYAVIGESYTKAESDEKYLVEHQSLKTINGESLIGEGDIVIKGGNDGYTKEEADARFQPVGEYLTAIPDDYVTEDELDGKGYLTEHQTLKTINGESLVGGGDITIQTDLSGYYTKAETDNLIASIPAGGGVSVVNITQAEYDALEVKESNVIYNITDAEAVCYTKTEIDGMIGDISNLLSEI